MTDEELAAIEARANAATQGPWGVSMDGVSTLTDGGQGYPLDFYPDSKDVVSAYDCYCNAPGRTKISDSDELFIAYARTDIPRLCAEIRRLRESLK